MATPVLPAWLSFKPRTSGHGGELRSSQIHELVEQCGFSCDLVDSSKKFSKYQLWIEGIKLLAIGRSKSFPTTANNPGLLGWQFLTTREHLRKQKTIRLFLWEDTNTWVPAWTAKTLGYSVVALPQNLESLTTGDPSPSKWKDELAALRLADEVFCISSEEVWLLANYKIRSKFLPYWPSKKRQQILFDLRTQREKRMPSESAPIVILGTAHNPPTRRGMEEALDWLRHCNLKQPVHVVGYGTETLKSNWRDLPGKIIGAVNEDTLIEILSECRLLICHQAFGSGALTRIAEAQLSGIPVLANTIAARGTQHLKDLYVYSTPEELDKLLQKHIPTPKPPDSPNLYWETFNQTLKSMSSC
ncbi:MAG: hypothetical protein AAF558_08965 [Verrucomicrobiota bacterium]